MARWKNKIKDNTKKNLIDNLENKIDKNDANNGIYILKETNPENIFSILSKKNKKKIKIFRIKDIQKWIN